MTFGNCSGVRIDAGAFITAIDQAIVSVPKAFCYCLLICFCFVILLGGLMVESGEKISLHPLAWL